MIESMQKRLAQIRQRAAIQRWEYRQRNYARGVWFRLRRVLADAAEAYIIDEKDAERLVVQGHVVEPVGAELEPKRTLIFATQSEIGSLVSARGIPVRLNEVVGAAHVALVRFPREVTPREG